MRVAGALVWVAVGIAGAEAFDRFAGAAPAAPAPPLSVAYAPETDLERIDVALIGEAARNLDVAAYVLTDRAIVRAIGEAAARGARARVLLDSDAPAKDPDGMLATLAGTPGVEVRVKPAGDLMHLKAYAVDGATLRLGSANFSRSGETRQDNDLVVIRSAAEAARFTEIFDRVWRIAK